MTYCLGFVYGGSAYLLGDTVLTTPPFATVAKTTSFGELIAPPPDEQFLEFATKVVVASERCMVAIAGDFTRALDCVSYFQAALRTTDDIGAAVRQLALSVDRGSQHKFEFLIASYDTNGPSLWQWDSRRSEAQRCPTESAVAIGHPTHALNTHLGDAFQSIRVSGLDEEHVLPLVAAVYQATLLNSLNVSQGIGVGGVVLGGRVNGTGTHRLTDVNYVLCGNYPESVDMVQLRFREGGFAISSPHLDKALVCLQHCDADTWKKQWLQEIFDSFFQRTASHWVFISHHGLAGVLVADTKPFNVCRLFDARPKTNGLEQITLLRAFTDLQQEIFRAGRPPYFAVVRRQDSLRVLASSLFELKGTPIDTTMTEPPYAFRVRLNSNAWRKQ